MSPQCPQYSPISSCPPRGTSSVPIDCREVAATAPVTAGMAVGVLVCHVGHLLCAALQHCGELIGMGRDTETWRHGWDAETWRGHGDMKVTWGGDAEGDTRRGHGEDKETWVAHEDTEGAQRHGEDTGGNRGDAEGTW